MTPQVLSDIARLLGLGQDAVAIGFAVFLRIGAAMALLPGFGERSVPLRVRLGLGLAFTLVVAPAVAGPVQAALATAGAFPGLWLTEPVIGLSMGLSLRLLLWVLQIAGTIAAQSTSLAQAFAAAGAEPAPVVGQMLVTAGLALAVTLGLHWRLAAAMIDSYRSFPPGVITGGAGDLAQWIVGRVDAAFSLAFTLALPFACAALIYNVALGIINRAMPQLMVVFVGVPALTAGGLVMLLLAVPIMLTVWSRALQAVLAAPFGG